MLKNKEEDIKNLADSFLGGDSLAFNELARLIYSDILNISYRYLANMEDAKDALQVSLLKIHNGLKYFRNTSKLSTWIFRITINTSLDFLRRRRNIFNLGAKYKNEPKTENSSLKEDLDLRDRQALLRKEISRLPARQKNVFILRHYEGLSMAEISSTIGCSQSSVKTHLKRAVDALQKKMEVIS